MSWRKQEKERKEKKKKRRGLSLKKELLFGILIFTILLCTLFSVLGSRNFMAVVKYLYQDNAKKIAQVAAASVDGDRIEKYYATLKQDEKYKTTQKELDALTDQMDLLEIYVVKVDFENHSVTYIFDSIDKENYQLFYPDDTAEPMMLGNRSIGDEDWDVKNLKEIMQGKKQEEDYTYNYANGLAYTTAIVPIENSQGEVVALLGVDASMILYYGATIVFLLEMISISLITVVVFLILHGLFVNWRVVKPIKNITAEAKRFAETNEWKQNSLSKIGRKNEIGILADSIQKMEYDVKNYVENLVRITGEQERISAELNIATQIQASMLPNQFPAFPEREEFDIYATMDPAKEVGGDFYDFFLVDERHIAIVMADVSGKGVPAALFMMIAKMLLKDHTRPDRDPGEIFTEVNEILCESNSEGMFVTVFEGILDLVTGEFRYANAGHEMPFIKKEDCMEAYKIRPGFVMAGMEGMRYKTGVMQLEPGDKIFQYTDGVTEATNSENELYGMERLKAVLNERKEQSPKEILTAVKQDVDTFVGVAPQFDDVTMLCLEYKGKMNQGEKEKYESEK